MHLYLYICITLFVGISLFKESKQRKIINIIYLYLVKENNLNINILILLVSLSLSLYNVSMCTKPLVAIDFGISQETGKHILKIKRVPVDYDLISFLKLYPKGCTSLIPCGHCPECVMAYRRDWATRCVCESKCHFLNCFVTLTFDDDHISECSRKSFTDFIKALRNDGHELRYFGCYELGSSTGRSHFHSCLFGYMPSDLKYHGRSDSGEIMYTSEYLNKLWNKGFVIVQDFTPATASYVSGYVSKKFGADDGYLLMSTHPGIGFEWYQHNKDLIYNFDKVYVNINRFGSPTPRYFLKLLEKDGYDIVKLQNARTARAMTSAFNFARNHGFDYVDQIYKYKEFFALKKMSRFRRSL